jgi:hypothetical protein
MTNTKTTERPTEQIMRDLDMARAMDQTEAIERLSAELKKAINTIFSAEGYPFPPTKAEVEAAHVEADQEDSDRRRIAIYDAMELRDAHVEALAEEAARKAADEREQSDMDE